MKIIQVVGILKKIIAFIFSTERKIMSKSPVHQKYETNDYGCYEFDPQVNFSQFLEEARQHARDINLQRSSSCSEEKGKRRLGKDDKKSKKSWKRSLFSWWKFDRKSKPSPNAANGNGPNTSIPTKGYNSGPIPICRDGSGSGSGGGIDTRRRRPSSGPVSIFFNPTRKVENEIPYMSLDQPNDQYQTNSYGPVYLVT